MLDVAREIIGTQPILAAFLAIGVGFLVGQFAREKCVHQQYRIVPIQKLLRQTLRVSLGIKISGFAFRMNEQR